MITNSIFRIGLMFLCALQATVEMSNQTEHRNGRSPTYKELVDHLRIQAKKAMHSFPIQRDPLCTRIDKKYEQSVNKVFELVERNIPVIAEHGEQGRKLSGTEKETVRQNIKEIEESFISKLNGQEKVAKELLDLEEMLKHQLLSIDPRWKEVAEKVELKEVQTRHGESRRSLTPKEEKEKLNFDNAAESIKRSLRTGKHIAACILKEAETVLSEKKNIPHSLRHEAIEMFVSKSTKFFVLLDYMERLADRYFTMEEVKLEDRNTFDIHHEVYGTGARTHIRDFYVKLRDLQLDIFEKHANEKFPEILDMYQNHIFDESFLSMPALCAIIHSRYEKNEVDAQHMQYILDRQYAHLESSSPNSGVPDLTNPAYAEKAKMLSQQLKAHHKEVFKYLMTIAMKPNSLQSTDIQDIRNLLKPFVEENSKNPIDLGAGLRMKEREAALWVEKCLGARSIWKVWGTDLISSTYNRWASSPAAPAASEEEALEAGFLWNDFLVQHIKNPDHKELALALSNVFDGVTKVLTTLQLFIIKAELRERMEETAVEHLQRLSNGSIALLLKRVCDRKIDSMERPYQVARPLEVYMKSVHAVQCAVKNGQVQGSNTPYAIPGHGLSYSKYFFYVGLARDMYQAMKSFLVEAGKELTDLSNATLLNTPYHLLYIDEINKMCNTQVECISARHKAVKTKTTLESIKSEIDLCYSAVSKRLLDRKWEATLSWTHTLAGLLDEFDYWLEPASMGVAEYKQFRAKAQVALDNIMDAYKEVFAFAQSVSHMHRLAVYKFKATVNLLHSKEYPDGRVFNMTDREDLEDISDNEEDQAGKDAVWQSTKLVQRSAQKEPEVESTSYFTDVEENSDCSTAQNDSGAPVHMPTPSSPPLEGLQASGHASDKAQGSKGYTTPYESQGLKNDENENESESEDEDEDDEDGKSKVVPSAPPLEEEEEFNTQETLASRQNPLQTNSALTRVVQSPSAHQKQSQISKKEKQAQVLPLNREDFADIPERDHDDTAPYEFCEMSSDRNESSMSIEPFFIGIGILVLVLAIFVFCMSIGKMKS
ncbi:hypothetical protein NECID01_0127 [Nematocida sp. AWRm77]|nr:hypothetical protein NECID01_0127 [Nematocida sp. AWRm77]